MSDSLQAHWIISRAKKAYTPVCDLKRYESFDEARKEAERLASKEDTVFYVYKLVGSAKPTQPPIEWMEST